MLKNTDPEEVLSYKCALGGGPVWDALNNRILWVDILPGEIHACAVETGEHKIFGAGQMVGAIALRQSGGLIAAMQHGFAAINLEDDMIHSIADPEEGLPDNRFNDGKCDPEGRFWAGTVSHHEKPGAGALYQLDKDFSVVKRMEKVTISNGLCWSPDKTTFYYIDTPSFQVKAYRYHRAAGELTDERVAVGVPREEGYPGGMTVDTEGMLWIAHWDGWQITRWDPQTGKLLTRVRMPVSRVTSCIFGGEGLSDLYITSARHGIHEKALGAQPLAGSLFVIRDCGFRGMPAIEFKG